MSLMSPTILLISIKKEYANMIFEGAKQVELRRVRPRHLKESDLVLVYVTSPEQALFGVFVVEKVVEMPTQQLWNKYGDKTGLTYECFQKYYKNSTTGCAILVREKITFESPIKLEKLREKWSDFRPPQSYYYLRDRDINIIKSMAKHDILSLTQKGEVYQTELITQS
ncbi:MAG TPA: ASCH domain-containing protein [Nostocaceae cyanobacterium]|nr:ASCH domain-containing protein [Nostocaceae cyanobacterium]